MAKKKQKDKFTTGLHFAKPEKKPLKTETVEEFLKRGGKITVINNKELTNE